MRRLATVSLLLLGVALAATKDSRADTAPTYTIQNGYCFLGPYNTLTPCPTSPTPTISLPLTTKLLDVSAGRSDPAGTTSYDVNITSRSACLPLNEPVIVYTLGKQGVGALTPVYPEYFPSPGAPVIIHVDQRPDSPRFGQASLRLEVYNAQVGPDGLDLKAVWPAEGVERVVNIIPPEPTSTPLPNVPTNTATPVPTATSTATATSTPTATPATAQPTNTATPYPTPAPGTFSVRACVDPQTLPGKTLGGGTGTLFAQTIPGSICYPSVQFSNGTSPTDAAYVSEASSGATADANGLVAFSFLENNDGSYGIASVSCSFGDQSATSYAYFFLRQVLPPGPNPGGVCPSGAGSGIQLTANVTQLNPPAGSNETVVGCFSLDGSGISNLPMLAEFHFSDGTVGFCSSQTDSSGVGSCTKGIGATRPGYPVVVEVFFTYNSALYKAVTAFVPVCATPNCRNG